MRSEVRPPPPVEERGPQFHLCQITDIYKMGRSRDRVGLSGLIKVRVGQGWFMLVRVVKVFGWVGLGGCVGGWLSWSGWLVGGGLECGYHNIIIDSL